MYDCPKRVSRKLDRLQIDYVISSKAPSSVEEVQVLCTIHKFLMGHIVPDKF